MPGVDDCRLFRLPQSADGRGTLCVAEGAAHVPFPIQRVFFVYDIPEGATRGDHAHKTLHEILVGLTGAFDVDLDDGRQRRTVRIEPGLALHLVPMVWATQARFSAGTSYAVLCSHLYDPDDYLRDYAIFKQAGE
jgi:hypothetical protein